MLAAYRQYVKWASYTKYTVGGATGTVDMAFLDVINKVFTDPRCSNWHILTGAAFLSFIQPMIVVFAFQRYFARGMLSGSVKG